MTYIDLHSTDIKKVQKSPKNWDVQVGAPHIHTLRTREKSKFFSHIERYVNDLHRPAPIEHTREGAFYARLESLARLHKI